MSIQPAQSSAIFSPPPAVREASAAQAAGPELKDAAPARAAAPDYDEYVPEDKTGLEHSGFYEPVNGEDGPGLRFDAPEEESPAARGKPSDKAEQTTTNTDRVDRELEKLRAEREKLSSQLRAASPEDAEGLQKRLARLENELRQKDNDAYRRAHAVIS